MGLFLFYSKFSFTGFVTNVGGEGVINSYDFSEGTFENTKVGGSDGNSIVLEDSFTSGAYTSKAFDINGNSVNWDNLDYSAIIPENSSVLFYARACETSDCSGTEFASVTAGVVNLTGIYFQYKIEMQALGSSPELSEVNITYLIINLTAEENTTAEENSTVPNIPITISSPKEDADEDDEDVNVKIIANTASGIWFSYDNGETNTTYTSKTTITLDEGDYTLIAWANDTEGNVNSTSVSFSVVLEEEEEEDSTTTTSSSSTSSEDSSDTVSEETVCTPNWKCGNWSECLNNSQTRSCSDDNSCNSEEGMPEASQSCNVAPTSASVKSSSKKSFLSIIGSVINVPVSFMFGDRIRAILFSVILFVLVGGFILFKFVLNSKFKVPVFKKKKKTSAYDSPPNTASSENNDNYEPYGA